MRFLLPHAVLSFYAPAKKTLRLSAARRPQDIKILSLTRLFADTADIGKYEIIKSLNN